MYINFTTPPPTFRRMKNASQWTNILLLLVAFKTLLDVSSAQDTSGESPCQMQILVFDDLTICTQDAGLAKSAAFLVADGQCRTANTATLPSDPLYSLLPGNYRAECVNSTAVRFLESGCISDQCSTTSLVQGASCDRNNSVASSLYSRVTIPEYLTYSGLDSSYTCTRASGSDVAVVFVIFGDCSAPGCTITTPAPIVAPVSSASPTTFAPVPTVSQPVTVPSTERPTTPTPILVTPPVFFSTGLPTQSPNSTIFQPALPSPTTIPPPSPVTVALPTPSSDGNRTMAPAFVAVPVVSPTTNAMTPQIQTPSQPTNGTPTVKSGIGVDLPTSSIEKKSGSGIGSGLIAGVAVSVAVVAIVLTMLLLRRRTRSSGKSTRVVDDVSDINVSRTVIGGGDKNNRDTDDELHQQKRTTNEIWIDPNADDVSTLDGGTVVPGFCAVQDEPTASVNLDFDFDANRYRTDIEDRTHSHLTASTNPTAFTNVSKLGIRAEHDFADDVSFEEQFAEMDDEDIQTLKFDDDKNSIANRVKPFEVKAPAGKLGMVVDTPNGGVPVVRALKADSVLSGSVQVGDRLISVDRINVTSMTALEVSNLISLKQSQSRLLIFCRLDN
jgi:hypothetical protein